jgi:hypothetical protein
MQYTKGVMHKDLQRNSQEHYQNTSKLNSVSNNITLNITITILDIIQPPVFYLKHDVSETGFCLHLHVEPAQVGQLESASICLQTPAGQGQGYITTNNQSVSMSWYRAQSRTVDQSLLSP